MKTWILALAALPLGACATVTRGTTEQIAFTSEPSGAAVQTTIGLACPATPCTLEVPRKNEFTALFRLPGHRDVEIPVLTRVGGGGVAGVAGNVIVGGVVGIVVDASTGAALEHYPNPVHATLVPLALPSKRMRPAPRPRGPVRTAPATM